MEGRLKSSKVVIVRGIGDIKEADFKLLFRNEHLSGGGEIEELALFRETENATIVYRDEKVAKRVLQRKAITYNENNLHVKPWPQNQPFGDVSTVLVTSSATQSPDTVKLLCSSKEQTGGDRVQNVNKLSDTEFLVKFEQREDARNVLQRSEFEYEGTTYTIKVYTPPPPGEWDGCTVEITNIPDSMGWGTFGLLYMDQESSGAGRGRILQSSFKEGLSSATITYEKKEASDCFVLGELHVVACACFAIDAEAVLRKGVCEYEGCRMMANIPGTKDLAADHERESETGSSIKITGKELQQDKIEALFGNKSKSGGGPIQRVVINDARDVAVIHFLEDSAAKEVLAQHERNRLSFGFFHAKLDISLCHTAAARPNTDQEHSGNVSIIDRNLSCAIEVQNIPDNTTEMTLRQIFQVESKTGGGPLEGCVYVEDEGRAVLHYQSQEVAARVMFQYNRDGLTLEGADLCLEMMTSKSNSTATPHAGTKAAYVKNIPEDQHSEDLKKYFEYYLPYSRVQQVTFGTKVGVALVTFDKFPGGVQLYNLVCQRPLYTNMLEIEAVEKEKTIEVYKYGDQSMETLEAYFAFTKSSSGGEIEESREEQYMDMKVALITFKKHETVRSVLSQKTHKNNRMTLHVAEHFHGIGFVPPGHDTSKQNQKPADVVFSFPETQILAFVLARTKEKQLLEKEVKSLDATVIWPSRPSEPVIFRYNSRETKNTKQSGIWKSKVEENAHNFYKRYLSREISIRKAGWAELKTECQGMDWKELEHLFKDDFYFVAFVGHKEQVEDQANEIQKRKAVIMRNLQRKGDMVTETKQYELHELKLMNMHDMKAKAERAYEDMKVKIDEDEGEVLIYGVASEVKEVQKKMSEFVKDISGGSMRLSNLKLAIVKKKAVTDYLDEQLTKANLKVVWVLLENDVYLYSPAKDHLDNGAQIIKESLIEKSVDFATVNKDLLRTPRWDHFRQSFASQYDDYAVLHPSERELQIAGLVTVMKDALELVKRFVHNNSAAFLHIRVGKHEASYIKRYLTPSLEEELDKLRQEGHTLTVKPSMKESEPGYAVETTTNAAPAVRKRLEEFCNKILHLDHHVTKPGAISYFTSSEGSTCLLGIEEKYRVSIVIDPEDEVSSQTTQYSEVTFKQFPGKKLILEKGDITVMKVDAIVNAADSKLDHGGGIAKAIVSKGGQDIQTECTKHIQTHGQMTPGQVFVSGAGKLPCDKVIHTVGPKWNGGSAKEEEELNKAVTVPLYEAYRLGMASLAMPAISTGKYGYPIDVACGILVQAVLTFMQQEPQPQRIHLVDNNEQVISACQRVLTQVGGGNVQVKHFKGSVEDKAKEPGYTGPGTEEGKPSTSREKEDVSKEDPYWKRSTKNNAVLTKEGLEVIIIKGSITDHRTEAIVNMTARDLNLSNGVVSKIVLQQAGPGIQDECRKSHPSGIKHGQVAVTSGGRHPYWKKIYHGACSQHSFTAEREMEKFVLGCLVVADNDNIKTIAFPSLGTGSLGFQGQVTARIIYKKVRDFSVKHPTTSLKTVYIVIFDTHIFKDFETCIDELLQPGYVSVQKDPSSSRGQPKTQVTTKEGVIVKVEGGSIVNQTADVIVNLTSKEFDLTSGYLAKQIHEKAGPAVQNELNQKTSGGVKNCEVVETTAGNLKCKVIYHGTCAPFKAVGSTKEIAAFVENCIERASGSKKTSIAIPALGTGALGYSRDSIITTFFSVVNKFSAANVGASLKLIVFVNIDGGIQRAFENRLWELEGPGVAAKPSEPLPDEEMVKRDRVLLAAWRVATARGNRHPVKKKKSSQQMTVRVYSMTKTKIKDAIDEIDSVARKQVMAKEFSETKHREKIKQLTPKLIEQIKKIEDSFDVEITVDQGTNNRILVEGSASDTADAIKEIMEIFNDIDRHLLEEKNKERINKQVQWRYLDGNFVDYPKDINVLIEIAYTDGKNEVTWHEQSESGHRGLVFTIDFKSMEETRNGKERCKVRRNVEGADKGFERPQTWTEMEDGKDVDVVTLSSNSKEYNDVVSSFASSMAILKASYQHIVEIRRVQNIVLYQSYMAKRMSMEQKVHKGLNKVQQFERTLWHATAESTLNEINRNGFNRSFSGAKHGARFGNGAYFATEAHFAHGYAKDGPNGEKYMYRSQVLTGDFTQGESGLLVAPSKDPADSSIKYDSVVDSPSNPGQWVIFGDFLAYPGHIIVYK